MAEQETRSQSCSIAGLVTDAQTQLPVPRARIEIVSGPPAFEQARGNKQKRSPNWKFLSERLDRTETRPDGSYRFVNLPAGTYQLRCSVKLSNYEPAEATAENSVGDLSKPTLQWTNIQLKQKSTDALNQTTSNQDTSTPDAAKQDVTKQSVSKQSIPKQNGPKK